MTEHDIHTLLDLACAPDNDALRPTSTTADQKTGADQTTASSVADLASADLRRGHAAKTRRRARYAALGATGLAVLSVGGMGIYGLRDGAPGQIAINRDAGPHHDQSNTRHRPVAAIRLVAKHLDADPYTFATTPAGWAVQGRTPFAVTIAPGDGSVSDNPTDFQGKLVIMLDRGRQAGDVLSYDGRDFVKRGDSGYTTLVTHTRPGEPEGWVAVQFPDDAGWTTDTMLKFLSTVRVNASAKAGLG